MGLVKPNCLIEAMICSTLPLRMRAGIARVGLEASRCPVGHCQAMKNRHSVKVSEQNGNVLLVDGI